MRFCRARRSVRSVDHGAGSPVQRSALDAAIDTLGVNDIKTLQFTTSGATFSQRQDCSRVERQGRHDRRELRGVVKAACRLRPSSEADEPEIAERGVAPEKIHHRSRVHATPGPSAFDTEFLYARAPQLRRKRQRFGLPLHKALTM